MLSRKLYASFAVLVLMLGVYPTVAWADDSGLAGKWKMVAISPDGNEVPWTLTIAYADGKYSGTLNSDQGEVPAKDFKTDGTMVSMTTPYEGNDYEVKLKLIDGKLKGTWSGGGDSGDVHGEKAPNP
jgi:hypothetical protein